MFGSNFAYRWMLFQKFTAGDVRSQFEQSNLEKMLGVITLLPNFHVCQQNLIVISSQLIIIILHLISSPTCSS